jgi:thiamine biosynthesis lipoprotein
MVPGRDPTRPESHATTHRAMGTTFQIFIAGKSDREARQASEEAFELLDRLEARLSRHRSTSEVSQVARLDAGEATRVSLPTFSCLEAAMRIHRATGGAFDVTAGPLHRCRLGAAGQPRTPADEELANARARTGMALLELDPATVSVRTRVAGVEVDLGGIGKGFAVDRMLAQLGEWGVEAALVHGGHSSVRAVGSGPEGRGWPVAAPDAGDPDGSPRVLRLEGRALGASGVDTKGLHIVNPRTGRLAEQYRAAWVLAPTATEADALSTAFLVMTPHEIEAYCRRDPAIAALLLGRRERRGEALRFGPWPA